MQGGVVGWAISLGYQCWLVFGAAIVKPFIPKLDRSTEGCDVSNYTLYNTTTEAQYYTTAYSLYENGTTIDNTLQDDK